MRIFTKIDVRFYTLKFLQKLIIAKLPSHKSHFSWATVRLLIIDERMSDKNEEVKSSCFYEEKSNSLLQHVHKLLGDY